MKVADMHCDTILAILRGKEQGKEISLCKNNLNVDLERMKKGDYLIQNFAIFLDLEDPMLAGSPFRYAMKMADVFYREMEKNKDWIRPVTKYEEIEENRKNGRMSALLTLEEGEICEGDPALLRDFYRMGARMMTLTWNYPNQLGYPAKATGGEFAGKVFSEAGYGLTARGIEFLEEMENLGMIIDVAHLNDAGIRDVLKFTKKPFVASHITDIFCMCHNILRSAHNRLSIFPVAQEICIIIQPDHTASFPDCFQKFIIQVSRMTAQMSRVGMARYKRL